MNIRNYRKHLSGEAAFKSFVPTPLSEIQVIHTEELDKLIMETESAMQQFNDDASQLSEEQIKQLMTICLKPLHTPLKRWTSCR